MKMRTCRGSYDNTCECGCQEKDDGSESTVNDLLCAGDINQGFNSNLEILQVSGHPDGRGLPDCFIVKDTRTGRVGEYTFNDA